MRQIVVSETDAGQRLDKYLHKVLPEAPKGFLYKMLRKKNITLNGAKAAGSEKLNPGDEIRMFLSEETMEKFSAAAKAPKGRQTPETLHMPKGENGLRPEATDPEIIYEDAQALLVNKPAGLLSQKGAKEDYSLTDWVREYLCEQAGGQLAPGFSPGICNRLDRNTSGIVAAGKSVRALQELSALFRQRSLGKYYLCPVRGVIEKEERLQGYLKKSKEGNRVTLCSAGQDASMYIETAYRPLGNNGRLTLLEVELLTGKTHQIRAHLAGMGHPLAGDAKYGGFRWGRYCMEQWGIRFQMLHAWRLEMPVCVGELKSLSQRTFYADLPGQFQDFLQKEHLEEFIPWKKKSEKKAVLKEAMEYVRMIIFVIVVVFIVNNVVLINAKIPSESMEKTIMTNDRIFGFRLAYKFQEPKRYDIVIFKYPDDPSQLFIKRIIGLPGETVAIRDGKVYINDSEAPLDDSFCPEEPYGDYGPYTVPEESYFMLGDNRNYSKDSRFWENQYVPDDQIVGKALIRYFPSIKKLG